jgi:hypothetical protein
MEQMDEEKALQLKNKIHLLTYFIVKCEQEDPLEEDENEWHPDFEQAISQILFVNEHGYLEEEQMHELNNLYSKWLDRFDRLGFTDQPLSEHSDLEDEIFELLKKHMSDAS